MDDYVELGRATGAYGFRGWVRVQPLASGEVLRKVKHWRLKPMVGNPMDLTIDAVREHGGGLIAKWVGCDSKESADQLKGTIYVARADFPEATEDEVWAVDLIGCKVVNQAGEELGVVSRIGSNGAQDLLEVEYEASGKKQAFMVPLVKDVYLLKIDTDAREITVDWQLDWR